MLFDTLDGIGPGCIAPVLHLCNISMGHCLAVYMRSIAVYMCSTYPIDNHVEVILVHVQLVWENILEFRNKLKNRIVGR